MRNIFKSSAPNINLFSLMVMGVVAATMGAQAQVTNIVRPAGVENKPQTSISTAATSSNGIDYHGGPVMLGPHKVYLIWYGNWSQDRATTILPVFISNMNRTAYFNITSTYTDGSGQSIDDTVFLDGQVFDNYSQGSALSDQDVRDVVSLPLGNGSLPTDPDGIYFVLTSSDVDQSGSGGEFCVNYCGFHNHALLNGNDIKYAFVGNAARCLSACAAPNLGSGPNNDAGADAMANVMAHELTETVTDPDLNAWFDSNGEEVGDKCNFNFGPEFTAANGAPANVTFGDRDFLIQREWINLSGGFCTIGHGFVVTAASRSLTAEQFSSDSTTLTIKSLTGFSGPVTLSISPLPTGVSATFGANPTDTGTTTTLTLRAGLKATPGSYLMTLVGTSNGTLSSIPINFTITKLNTTN